MRNLLRIVIAISMCALMFGFKGFSSRLLPHSRTGTTRSVTLERAPVENLESSTEMKLGVLLLNLGGPESQSDVEGFLYNLFADPDIIRLPSIFTAFQKPIAYFIAKRRAPQSRAAYQSIGGGSPIVQYTGDQASLIENELKERGYDAKCYFAMRYWHPFTENVLEQMKTDKVNAMVIIPLYPQFSISTSGSSLRVLQDIFFKDPEKWGPDKVLHTVVPAWYYRQGYVNAMAELILKEIMEYTAEERAEGLHVLFSAHGVPKSYIEAGDPYQRQIEDCVTLVSREVALKLASPQSRPAGLSEIQAMTLVSGENPLKFHLSFQSRVGPVMWLQPYTETKLKELGNAGVKNLIVVPVSFVSEHVETLEEIDMEYRELAEEYGVHKWRRVPALNTDASFITDMADLVVDALNSPSVSVSEAQSSSEVMMDSNTVIDKRMGGAGSSSTAQVLSRNNRGFLAVSLALLAGLVSFHPVLETLGVDKPQFLNIIPRFF